MSPLQRLNAYLTATEKRLRLLALCRGIAVVGAAALLMTVALAGVSNAFSFSSPSLQAGRFLLFLSIGIAAAFGIALPLVRLTSRRAAKLIEARVPGLDQRMLTLSDRKSDDPFNEILADETLEIIGNKDASKLVRTPRVIAFASGAAASFGVLLWLIAAGPGYLGYGAAALWVGPSSSAQPFYGLQISPGNIAIRRKTDQLITAAPAGFDPAQVRLLARYEGTSKWEEVSMQRGRNRSQFEFVMAGVPESFEYYAQAAGVRSQTYRVRVVDPPTVKRLRVTYRYPRWTGLPSLTEDPGGDLRGVEGTEADISVETDRPLTDGVLVLDDGRRIPLQQGTGAQHTGRLVLERDGLYHVAALDRNEAVRLTEDFFIEARKDDAPTVRLVRPGRDAKASPIEEVTLAVQAQDDFGLANVSIKYSVNGGPERDLPLVRGGRPKSAERSAVLALEDFKLQPGDIVTLYATARDARKSTKTDISFIQAEPFERNYQQSQQAGGGGGGSGGDQSEISERQKEIIAATWNQLRDEGKPSRAKENSAFLSEVQSKLRDQTESLAKRMRNRQLAGASESFETFSDEMEKAAQSMSGAADKLKRRDWRTALEPEQKALQHLLRAEAVFRDIQVAFGNQRDGGGRGSSNARDLASLFDLELDTEKNQYETGQLGGEMGQQGGKLDEAFQKLERLARRQQELAEQNRKSAQSFQQRWQQEMLRREADELRREMAELDRGDPRLRQAIERLSKAAEGMRRANSSQAGGSPGQAGAESQRAARELEDARRALEGSRREQASEQLNDLVRKSEELAGRQQEFSDRLQETFGDAFGNQLHEQGAAPRPGQQEGAASRLRSRTPSLFSGPGREKANALASEQDKVRESLQELERMMQDNARSTAGSQPVAAAKLREALGNMQQDELRARMKVNGDLLRRGLGPYTVMRQHPITRGLQRLNEQLREAQSALGDAPGKSDPNAERMLELADQMRQRLERGAEEGRSTASDLVEQTMRDLSALEAEGRAGPRGVRGELNGLRSGLQRIRGNRTANPLAVLDQMRAEILPRLAQLEMRLGGRREGDAAQVRAGAQERVPESYAGAVADYFRSLSRGPKDQAR